MSATEGSSDPNTENLSTPEEEAAMMDGWAASAGTQLDQNSIDSLFDSPSTPEATGPQRGLELLVGTAIVGYDRLPMLDIVIDRFSRLLTTSFRKFTSDNADISVGKTRPIRLGDFLNQISFPAMIAVIRAEQWDGYILAALNSPLIASVVDVLLGGRRNHTQPIEGRPYTPIERTLIERLVGDVMTGDLKKAFEAVCDIDFIPERYESTPTYAAITKLSSAALMFRAEVSMDSGRGGGIDFLIPYSVLEPVRDVLSQEFMGKKSSGDSIWHSHLHQEVPQASVELRAVLEQRMIAVNEVARWKPGSLLVLERRSSDPVDLYCEDMLVARAHMGEHSGRIALSLDETRLEAARGKLQKDVPEAGAAGN